MICLLAHVVASMLAGTEGETMSVLEERFRDHFAPWSISIPPGHVAKRRRGKIVDGGWAIWYLFGEDERGEYLDYNASHRMTNDRHIRIREDSAEEHLLTISTMRTASQDPEEDERLAAEYLEENRRVAKMLEEKGLASRAMSLGESSSTGT